MLAEAIEQAGVGDDYDDTDGFGDRWPRTSPRSKPTRA